MRRTIVCFTARDSENLGMGAGDRRNVEVGAKRWGGEGGICQVEEWMWGRGHD